MNYKNILVTGAQGFAGKNLIKALKLRADLNLNIFAYSHNLNKPDELEEFCSSCDLIFNFAGVNRPVNNEDFIIGNVKFLAEILDKIKKNNKIKIMLASSVQASLTGRFANSEYGRSKLEAEKLLINYASNINNKAEIFIYRLPNLAGAGVRPNYNSAIATFCNAIANNLEYKITDRNIMLEIVFIEDLVCEMLNLLDDKAHRLEDEDFYYYVPVSYKASLGEIVDLLNYFKNYNRVHENAGGFELKLYKMYLSYIKIKEA